MSISMITDKCNGCGLCARSCPYNAIEIVDKKAMWLENRCTLCGACLDSCKFGALQGSTFDKIVPDFSAYKGVWVLAETRDGAIHTSTLELLSSARDLASTLGEEVVSIVLGDFEETIFDKLISHGADRLIVVKNPGLDPYNTNIYTHVISKIITKWRPAVLLIAATSLGRDLAPRLARRLGLGLTADCTKLAIDPDERLLLQTRPAFGGNIMATIVTRYSRPQLATVRPGVMKPADPDLTRKGAVFFEDIKLPVEMDAVKILECVANLKGSNNLCDAPIIVAGGRPLCSEKGIDVLTRFCELIGAEKGCTRVVVEEGFMSADRQIGQTGQTVRPEIYFACGISGAVQHRAGMDGSRYIVAINKDPDAPIFEIADIAVVGDVFEIIPALSRTISNLKNHTQQSGSH